MTEQEREDFINGIVNGIVDDLTAPEFIIEDGVLEINETYDIEQELYA